MRQPHRFHITQQWDLEQAVHVLVIIFADGPRRQASGGLLTDEAEGCHGKLTKQGLASWRWQASETPQVAPTPSKVTGKEYARHGVW
jgi:hypothetical protein